MLYKTQKRRALILQGNIWKAILLLTIPAAINEFIRAAYNLIDAYFAAYIGGAEIAAITFVAPINMLLGNISVGLAIAGTNLIAREIGREDYKKARNISGQLLIAGVTAGVITAMISYVYSREIILSASATASILDAANIYFKLTALSAPFLFINSIYISIKRAEGDTFKAMVINTIAMGLKILMSYIFIVHLKFGVAGLAYSTIIGTIFVSLYAIYDLFLKESIIKLRLADFKFMKDFYGVFFLLAIPIVIEKSSISFSFILINKYVLDYGAAVLAGYGIANRFNSLAFSSITGFASGLSPVISQNLGAKNEKRARAAIGKTFIMALGIAGIASLILIPFREYFISRFVKNEPDVIYHTINAMGVYTISVIPWALIQVSNGVFQGTGHTHYNLIISLIRIYVFRLPLIVILSKFAHFEEYNIWYGMLLSNILTGLVSLTICLWHSRNLRLVGERKNV